MRLADLEKKEFSKTFRGYDTHEVEKFVKEICTYCRSLEIKVLALEQKILSFEQQEQFIKSAIVSAEQAALSITSKAANTARAVQDRAEKEAKNLISSTMEETKAYRQQLHKYFFNTERELHMIIDRFYSLARNHMHMLEKELFQEIQAAASHLDIDCNVLFNPNTSDKVVETEDKGNCGSISRFKKIENSLLLGKVLQQDIVNGDGCVVVEKGTIITPNLISSLISKGLYGELVAAIDSSGE